jgi:predicted ATPase/DNA-binding SARP family transcriptional activator
VEIGYLGALEVRDAGCTVAVPGQRLRRLLVQLALAPGSWVSVGALAEAVWADGTPADPANSLQSLVSRLRRVLGRPELVEQSAAGYRLALAPASVDAVRFGRLVADGRRLLEAGDDAAATTALAGALALWRGRPLADDDSPEAEARRAALEDLRLQALRDRAALAVRAGRGAEVVAELEELTAAHPLREDLVLVLMDALVAAGRPAEALAAYERARAGLADTLGTDPSPALRARHLEVLRQGERPVAPPTNLRSALTSFVGRDDDVRTVRERLATSRLVTVVGAGGSGKTRLVSEVASTLLHDPVRPGTPTLGFPDGIWLVELAPVTDPAAVPQTVLEHLGLREVALPDQRSERSRLDGRARLLEVLDEAACLLVVDNCEHLVDAVADLVDEVLGRCPRVTVLATSREPLGIDGETLYPLGPLPLPREGIAPADAAGVASVRLLMDRARAQDPDVELDAAGLEIVRRLDGLPLAIELAAARLRVLSPAEVAERLADRFRLLTGGRRTATPRHRTLRAVVEWSWELLTPIEREVAEHFSVFASGATERSVAAVCPSWRDAGGPEDLADVLHALVDKSLLIATRTPAGTRFRMLETLREYGAERLAEQGLITAARAAHAAHFAGLVARTDPDLRGPGQLEALRLLDTEHDDVLLALRFLGDTGDAAGALRLAVHLGWYWLLRESGQEAARWLRYARDVPGAEEVPEAVLAEAFAALLAFGTGEVQVQPGTVALAGRLGAARLDHPAAVILRPLLLFLAEDRAGAEAALTATSGSADPWLRAAGRMLQMAYAENDGDVATLRRHAGAGVPEWESIGDRWGLATMLSSRGQVRTMDGDLRGASEDLERAAELIRLLGGHDDHVMVTMRLADLRLRAGDPAGARRHLESMRETRSYGAGELLRGILVGCTAIGIALAEDDEAAARRGHDDLEIVLSSLGEPNPMQAHGTAAAHAAAGMAALRLGDVEDAEAHVREAYRQGLLTNDRPVMAAVALTIAAWARSIGLSRDAAVVLGAGNRLRGAEDPTNPVVRHLTEILREDLGAEFDHCLAEGESLGGEEAAVRVDPDVLLPAPTGTVGAGTGR